MTRAPRYGLARILSKRGICSRSKAERWIREGRVRVDGRVVTDPESPTALDAAGIDIVAAERGAAQADVTTVPGTRDSGDPGGSGDPGRSVAPSGHRYLMLNKPRGLVTTARDEHGRDTVYRCFDDARDLGWIAPVGRLDRASEGLLLFSSDPAWAARVTAPATGPAKTYHVQVDAIPSSQQLQAMVAGVDAGGDLLRAASASLLRQGGRNAWLEVVLDEGRNRQIRRLLTALDIGVLRLVRIAIGDLALGDLGKGAWRPLTPAEVAMLAPPGEVSSRSPRVPARSG